MSKNKLIPELRFPEFVNEGEWDIKEFSKFIKLDRGSSPRPIQEYLTQDVSGVNWIKIGDTKNAINSVIYQVEEKITTKGAEKSRRVEKGELILANSMSFGKTYELAIEGCIYDGWFVLRKYDKYFVKPFLMQLLNSDFLQNQYKRLSAGGIVQNISSDIVYNSKLFHTSLFEQQKIASCLSSLDEVIAAHSQKLETLKDHKKGLMQNLFPQEGETVPKRRFKEFVKDGEWVATVLENISSKIMVGIASAATHAYRKSGIILFRNQNIKEGYLDDNDILYIDENYEKEHINKRLKAGDLLTARTGYPGTTCVVPEKYEGSQSFTTLITRPKRNVINSSYLSYYINSETGQAFFNATKIGGGQQNVNAGALAEMPIIYPSKKEQQKIASCLSALDALITAQAEKIEQLKLHKKGLMQGLFPNVND